MRLLRTLLTAVVAGMLVLGSAGVAEAAGTSATPHASAVKLSWDGSEFSDFATESIVGMPVAIPGDTAARTLIVRNDGPTDATLRVSIVDVDLLDPHEPDIHHQVGTDEGNFYRDVRIDWDGGEASLKQLEENGTTRLLEVPLARGEQREVRLGFTFDRASTAGNSANVEPREGSFGVRFALGGDTGGANAGANAEAGAASTADATAGAEADATSTADAGTSADAETSDDASATANAAATSAASSTANASSIANADAGTSADAAAGGTGGPLPRTGGALWWLAVIGALCVGIGAGLIRVVRRRA